MKKPPAFLAAPVVIVLLFLAPFFLVQILPDSITDKTWIYTQRAPDGTEESTWISHSVRNGIFRWFNPGTHPGLLRLSLFLQQYYFAPIATVLHKSLGLNSYKFL